MRSPCLFPLIVVVLIGFVGSLLASDVEELRARAKAMRNEASALAEKGNKEQAEQLERGALKLLEAAERLESHSKGNAKADLSKEAGHLKEHLIDLQAMQRKLKESGASEKELAEMRERIAGTEQKLRMALHETGKGPKPKPTDVQKMDETSRRIHHLHVAAENLKLADAPDLVHLVMQQAAAMEREVQESRKYPAAMPHKKGGEHGPDVIDALRAEVERLRAEVRELRERVDNR